MNIPEQWNVVLKSVQKIFPRAVIAGGSLRDLDYNRPIKDVDIFAPIEDIDIDGGKFDYLVMHMFPNAVIKTASIYQQTLSKDFDRNVYIVYDLNVEGFAFELIVGDLAAIDITTFDFSICQIKYDGTTVMSTFEYNKTKENSIITCTNEQSPYRIEGMVQRLKAKYPEFKIVDPRGNEYGII